MSTMEMDGPPRRGSSVSAGAAQRDRSRAPTANTNDHAVLQREGDAAGKAQATNRAGSKAGIQNADSVDTFRSNGKLIFRPQYGKDVDVDEDDDYDDIEGASSDSLLSMFEGGKTQVPNPSRHKVERAHGDPNVKDEVKVKLEPGLTATEATSNASTRDSFVVAGSKRKHDGGGSTNPFLSMSAAGLQPSKKARASDVGVDMDDSVNKPRPSAVSEGKRPAVVKSDTTAPPVKSTGIVSSKEGESNEKAARKVSSRGTGITLLECLSLAHLQSQRVLRDLPDATQPDPEGSYGVLLDAVSRIRTENEARPGRIHYNMSLPTIIAALDSSADLHMYLERLGVEMLISVLSAGHALMSSIAHTDGYVRPSEQSYAVPAGKRNNKREEDIDDDKANQAGPSRVRRGDRNN